MSGQPRRRNPTWVSDRPPPELPIGPTGWLRVIGKGLPLVLLLSGGLSLLLALRLVERPVFGQRRPFTPFITQGVCKAALWLIGLRQRVEGTPMRAPGAVVANHSSWLDIFVLNARKRVYFVSKAEVAGWAGIGWLARATGTVFIAREAQRAASQVAMLKERLAAGHRLVVFPEGTSTDGLRVLDFKPTLFAAFFDTALSVDLWVQPVSLIYEAPRGADRRVYGWWGDMDFGPHLAGLLAMPAHGLVTVRYHPPVRVADVADRKTLAAQTCAAVRQGLDEAGITPDD